MLLCLPPRHFGDRHCHLPPCHFGDTWGCHLPHHHTNAHGSQQLAKRGTRGKDASNRGEATGNNQPAQQKDKRVVQHERQRNDSNGDNDNGDGDRGNNKDNGNNVGSGGQHCRLTLMAMEWMRMVSVQK
jgi:hypothetical protein